MLISWRNVFIFCFVISDLSDCQFFVLWFTTISCLIFFHRTAQNCWHFLDLKDLSYLYPSLSIVRHLLSLRACSYTSTEEVLLHKHQNHTRCSWYFLCHCAQKNLTSGYHFLRLFIFVSIVVLPKELVKGSERARSLGGLLFGSRGPFPSSSRRVFLRLLLGFEKLPLAGFV